MDSIRIDEKAIAETAKRVGQIATQMNDALTGLALGIGNLAETIRAKFDALYPSIYSTLANPFLYMGFSYEYIDRLTAITERYPTYPIADIMKRILAENGGTMAAIVEPDEMMEELGFAIGYEKVYGDGARYTGPGPERQRQIEERVKQRHMAGMLSLNNLQRKR